MNRFKRKKHFRSNIISPGIREIHHENITKTCSPLTQTKVEKNISKKGKHSFNSIYYKRFSFRGLHNKIMALLAGFFSFNAILLTIPKAYYIIFFYFVLAPMLLYQWCDYMFKNITFVSKGNGREKNSLMF